MKTSLREKLAELEHEQWMKWSQNLADMEGLSKRTLKRWEELWIPYQKLPENVKDLNRIWADEVLEVVRRYLSSLVIELSEG